MRRIVRINKDRYAVRMKHRVIVLTLFSLLISLGAGCKDQGQKIQKTAERAFDGADYLRCIDSAQKQYNELTKNGTIEPKDEWVASFEAIKKDCQIKYGN